MGSDNPDVLDFAGDYNLNGIILQSHDGTGGRLGRTRWRQYTRTSFKSSTSTKV